MYVLLRQCHFFQIIIEMEPLVRKRYLLLTMIPQNSTPARLYGQEIFSHLTRRLDGILVNMLSLQTPCLCTKKFNTVGPFIHTCRRNNGLPTQKSTFLIWVDVACPSFLFVWNFGFLVLRIVLWCRYCLMSFPFSVIRHLQIVPVHIHQETTEIFFNFWSIFFFVWFNFWIQRLSEFFTQ